MSRIRKLWRGVIFTLCSVSSGFAQKAYTWQEIRDRFERGNPALKAAMLAVDESRAQEITANLRPNPEFTGYIDQIAPFSTNPYRPFANTLPFASTSYLHERQHKRELRLASAREGTVVTAAQQADTERTLLYTLRNAFVQALQQKAVTGRARENLSYYDRVLSVSRDRFHAGDIAQVDLDRLELQRVQYESDLQTASVNLRTAKINLLTLLNDRSPVESFDVTGAFGFPEQLPDLPEIRSAALATRPDLRAASATVQRARTDHDLAIANGSTDPVFAVNFARNPPIPAYFGVSMTIPLRVFDRNQGEKLRTGIEITRSERLRDANVAQVLSDVDSAYATVNSTLALLRPYRDRYLKQAVRIRDTVSFSYQHGGASLLDFLNAQNDYRSIELNYLNLIGSYLTAANQLNLAAGREVLP